MNGKLLWRTAQSIFVIFVAAVLVRNCREIKQDHEKLIRMEEQEKK